jgi:uncharacterized CHY-type Zn-finger protein
MSSSLEAEFLALQRRYPSFVRTADGFSVRLQPTQPDLPVPLAAADVDVAFSPSGTTGTTTTTTGGVPVLTVRPSAALPPKVALAFNLLLADQLARVPATVRQALRWLEQRGMGELLAAVIAVQDELANTTTTGGRQEEGAEASAVLPVPAGGSTSPPQPRRAPSATAATATTATAAASPFDGQASWSYAEQAAFESLLREYFGEKGRSLDDPDAWACVAAGVSAAAASSLASARGAAEAAAATPARRAAARTPEECVARFLALRHICRTWLERSVSSPWGGGAPSVPPPRFPSARPAEVGKRPPPLITATSAAGFSSAAGARSGTSGGGKKADGVAGAGAGASSRFGDQRVSLAELDADIDTEDGGRRKRRDQQQQQSLPGPGPEVSAQADDDAAAAAVSSSSSSAAAAAAAPIAFDEVEVDMFGRAIAPVHLHHDHEEDDNEEEDDGEEEEEDDDDDDDEDDEDEEGDEDDDDDGGPRPGGDGAGGRGGVGAGGAAGTRAAEGGAGGAEEEDEEEALPPPLRNIHLATPHRGMQVVLERLSILGTGTLAASALTVLIQCERCATVVSATMHGAALPSTAASPSSAASAAAAAGTSAAGGGGSGSGGGSADADALARASQWQMWCPRCSLLLQCAFRATLVHEGNPSLGYLDTNRARATSLLNASLLATCLECSTPAEIPRFSPPATFEASCRKCLWARLRVDARGAALVDATPDSAAAAAAAAAAASASGAGGRGKRSQKFAVGNPLPLEGTCKHYKRSYRWFRFPCCGTAYPCDECHDEASDHPAERAKRMICGHCAKEQPFTQNQPCVSCGGSMTKSVRATRFWEGGQGERDRSHMSKKDPRKFKGSSLKTKSKKAERVGPLKERKSTAGATAGGGGK